MGEINGHITRFSDSSFYDEVCVNCGATDTSRDLGELAYSCQSPGKPYANMQEYYADEEIEDDIENVHEIIQDTYNWGDSRDIP
jgi:hypothetical protein